MPRYPKTTKKPSARKAKAKVTKINKKKAKKNMDTFFLCAKAQTTLIPSQAISGFNYIYRHFPLLDSTSNGLNVTTIPEFKMYQSLYDKVRVNSIHIKVIPKANVLSQGTAQNDDSYTLDGDGKIHTCIDRDGPAPSSVTGIQKYPSYKAHSVMKPFTRMYSIKYPVNQWLDCQNLYASNGGLNLGMGYQGGITIYGENFLEDSGEVFNEPYASVEVWYNCVFQGKTGASISVSEAGVVTLTPYTATPLPMSPLGTGTQQETDATTIADRRVTYDNSGNQIVITG